MNCHYCRYNEVNRVQHHSDDCPEVAADKAKSMAIWRDGYNEGRYGNEPEPGQSKIWLLGWNSGNVALEEAQNGCSSWGE